jgi:hypothetical protein
VSGELLHEGCAVETIDSRVWGSLPKENIVGPVVKIIRGR